MLDSITSDLDTTSPPTNTDKTTNPISVTNTSSESTDGSLFFAAGAGSIALFGSVSYWRVNKKKI